MRAVLRRFDGATTLEAFVDTGRSFAREPAPTIRSGTCVRFLDALEGPTPLARIQLSLGVTVLVHRADVLLL